MRGHRQKLPLRILQSGSFQAKTSPDPYRGGKGPPLYAAALATNQAFWIRPSMPPEFQPDARLCVLVTLSNTS